MEQALARNRAVDLPPAAEVSDDRAEPEGRPAPARRGSASTVTGISNSRERRALEAKTPPSDRPACGRLNFRPVAQCAGAGRYRRLVANTARMERPAHRARLEGRLPPNRSSGLTRVAGCCPPRRMDDQSRSTSPKPWPASSVVRARASTRARPTTAPRRLQPVARGQAGMVRRSRRDLEAARGSRRAIRLHLDRARRRDRLRPRGRDRRGQRPCSRADEPAIVDPHSCARRRRRFTRGRIRVGVARVRWRARCCRRQNPGRRKRPVSITFRSNSFATARSWTRLERTVGFRRFEAKRRSARSQRRAVLPLRRARSGLAPEEECRPPSPEFLEQRFRNAKAMGLNTLRCHVKIPDRLYFDLADRLGLDRLARHALHANSSRRRTRETCAGFFASRWRRMALIRRSAIWTLFNEGWGIELDDNPDDRRWLIEIFDAAKALVPGEPARRQLALLPAQLPSQDRHRGLPLVQRLPAPERGLCGDGASLRAPRALGLVAARRRDEARRRAAGLLRIRRLGPAASRARFSRRTDASPGGSRAATSGICGAAYPHGIETRFRDAALAPIFGDLDGFVDAAQALPVPRAQISDRDAAVGTADFRLRHHGAQRHRSGNRTASWTS